MPTELEELVDFLHHGNTQIRQIAIENLVGYSTSQPSIFNAGQFTPVKDLKLLIRDYPPISNNALTILINLSDDREVLQSLATDDEFLESLLLRMSNPKEPNANLIAMLIANLAKSDDLKRIFSISRDVPNSLSSSKNAMDQLMDCFVKGAEGRYNEAADYDYLAYFFADIAKHPEGRSYFTSIREYDSVIPITKLIVFTEHKSNVRRKGVASTIKNTTFAIPSHPLLLSESEVDLLPYIVLPLMGAEDYSEEDSAHLPSSLQLLAADKTRDSDSAILITHLETLLLLTTTRAGRDHLREQVRVYPIVRELHLAIEDEDVREACDRLVQVLLRDEEDDGAGAVRDEGEGVGLVGDDEGRKEGVNTATAPATAPAAGTADGLHHYDVDDNDEDDEDEKITEIF
ncbi:MAG: hypothetical protein M1837_000989 [Sclerophora amabilis]|nr:MAG: hypothetical protein M1837_000989 [Sclerophora amabilis]